MEMNVRSFVDGGVLIAATFIFTGGFVSAYDVRGLIALAVGVVLLAVIVSTLVNRLWLCEKALGVAESDDMDDSEDNHAAI